MPYPLEPELADAVKAAIKNQVYTWESLEDEGTMQEWLWDYLIGRGEKELPTEAYDRPDNQPPIIKPDRKEEVKACFKEEQQFELFKTGKDYHYCLASVTDAEFNQHYQTIVNGMQELVDSGKVQDGYLVYLEDVPMHFLLQAPLVAGKWLDRKIVELAEWGALLKANSYQLSEEDRPLLAMAKFLRSDGQEASLEEIHKLLEQARQNLATFPGRTRKIDKRVYIHFQDYCEWPGRKVKGDLQSQVSPGLVKASWNRWIQDQGGKINDMTVKPLLSPVDEQDYYICYSGIEEALKRRNGILEDTRRWRYNPEKKEQSIKEWKVLLEIHLNDLYAYRQAINTISQSYFEGQPILFQDLARDLAEIITDTEELAGSFNEVLADLFKLSERIDLEAIHQKDAQKSKYRLGYIIDMAKAEALDSLGEGEEGIKLVERYV